MLTRERTRKLSHMLLHRVNLGILIILSNPMFALAQAQITKPDPPIVNTPSTVGRIPKWWGVRNNGIGIIGDSVITESGGNIGIDVTNPTQKLAVGGSVTASGAINTESYFSLKGNRLIVADGVKFNMFAGFGSGNANSTGDRNSFFGGNAGLSNTSGNANSFFGFFAGASNTSGGANSFFGLQAGYTNNAGTQNSFFGAVAGNNNTSGSRNSFFGTSAGYNTTSGSDNAFLGYGAGTNNSTGGSNSFFGVNSGLSNTSGSNNTFIGALSNGAAGISNATALGANAVVTQSNSVVLGNNANVGIGTSAPQAKLHVTGPTAGRFEGDVTITGNLSVSGTANLTASEALHANAADVAINFTGPLAGDVMGVQAATVVTSVAGKSAESVAIATDGFNAATNNNTGNTLVKRDASGSFSANTINSTQVSTSTVNLPQGTISSSQTALTLRGLTTPQGATGGSLTLGSGNFYYPGGSVTLAAGATAPDYNSAPGPFISLTGTDYSSGGDIMIASGHAYGANTGGAITLNTNGAYAGNNPSPGYISLQIQGNESLRVASNGNVGVGTATPQAKLHVTNLGGSAGQFDGNVTVNGNLTVSGTTNLSSSVVHDATLSGAGTTGSPLSVVSAPNGVVTTGSYANPTWITSLNGNKLTAGTVVKSLNGITDNVTLAAGNNVTITPSGSTLTISTNNSVPQYNPNQIALLRWYDINRSGNSFPTGTSPNGIAFDGAHLWVANAGENTVSKIRASDGMGLGTFAVGTEPRRVAFDGANVWVSNWNSSSVMKLRASDGQLLQTIPTGPQPGGLAFDGTNMWVASYGSGTVTKLRVSDGAVLGTFGAGASPLALAFDGANIWIANNLVQGGATKIRASDGAFQGTFGTESFPGDIAFDGSSVWITNTGPWSITKLRASDGAHQTTFLAGGVCCGGIAFDGVNLWFSGESILFKRRPSDGALLGAFSGLSIGSGIAFDGANIWVANRGNNSLGKF